MKSWSKITREYPVHLSQLSTGRRLSSFEHVKQFIQVNHAEIYNGMTDLSSIDKSRIKSLYEKWKGKKINQGEVQVFNDLYKLYVSS